MPDTPEQFAKRYLPITTTSSATGEVKCVVWKYVSYPQKFNSEGKALDLLPESHRNVLNKLAWYYKSRAEDAEDAAIQSHGGYNCTIKSLGIFQKNVWNAVQQCMLGKATPEEFKTSALLYTYWDLQTKDRTSGYKPRNHWAGVQQFANEFWGMDCNGFVGAYFKANFPVTGLGPTSDIPTGASVTVDKAGLAASSHPFAKGGKVRTSVEQLRPGDVFIYKHRHIALLGDMEMSFFDDVKNKEGDWETVCTKAQFRVYQARGTAVGGVQGTYYDITHKSGNEFTIKCVLPKPGSPETLKAIVRPKGVPEWS